MSQNPSDTAALHATLTLCLVPGVGPRTRRTLLECFGTAENVLGASIAQLLQVPGVGPKLARRVASATATIDADREIEICRQQNVAIVTESDTRYPRLLREIPDPPGVLFVRGACSQTISCRWRLSAHGTPRIMACGWLSD